MSQGAESASGVGAAQIGGSLSAGAASGTAYPPGHHKKFRRKRKELDALVPEDKVRRKSSSASHHDLLQHSDSDEGDSNYSQRMSKDNQVLWGRRGHCRIVRGTLNFIAYAVTTVGVLASLHLLMNTRRDLDTFTRRLNAVEASGSELPAKFHESHVRLQQLEKNQTSVWEALNALSQDMKSIAKKVDEMENSINGIKESLSGAPQLSSLPKDVANLQDSIATFGSSLQDAQSSIKAVKEEQGNIQNQLSKAVSNISAVQKLYNRLKNETSIPIKGREGAVKQESISTAFISLEEEVSHLSSDVSSLNTSFHSNLESELSFLNQSNNLRKGYNSSLHNITSRIKQLELDHSKDENNNVSSHVLNLSSDLLHLKDDVNGVQLQINNISQNVAVVKGVERKLEGSQVQMASSMSEIKQQLQKLDMTIKNLNPTTTQSPQMRPTKITQTRKSLLTSTHEGGDHPRRKRRSLSSILRNT